MLITAGKGFAILSALKPTPSAPQHRPFRTFGKGYVCPCYARRYLRAAISNNLLFVKTLVEYIISELADRTHINFSQLEHFFLDEIWFLCLVRLFNFMLTCLISWGIHHFDQRRGSPTLELWTFRAAIVCSSYCGIAAENRFFYFKYQANEIS